MITNQLSGLDPNGNYYATTYAYDVDGRQYQTIDANGTITDTVYDNLGRVVSTWVGTNDSVSGASGTPSYFDGANSGTGNNMTEVSPNIYDGGTVGDGNLTETIAYPDGNAGTNAVGTARVTLMDYDWRDWLVATQTGLTLSSTDSLVPADQQTGAVAGDAALLKLGINSQVPSTVGGHFQFQLSSDLNLWQNANRTTQYTGSNGISATGSPAPWYVEGTAVSASQGADSVTLYYIAPNGAAVLKLD